MTKILWALKQLTVITLLFVINLSLAQPAYSRGGGGGGGGCFSSETSILTPEGNKKIAQLHSGDYVTNYNFATHHLDRGIIGAIEVINASDYYVINRQTKVTATHPFYVKKEANIKLIEVENLHEGDRLITQNNSLQIVSSIEHIKQPLTVYNLKAIDPNHNFYADGFLVHNKGGGGGGSIGGGSIGGGSSGYATIDEKTLPGFLKAAIVLIFSLSCIVFWQQISNFFLFFGKKFTEDSELMAFATKINPDFKNKYSVWYFKDDQIWQEIPPQPELAETQYQHLISKTELIKQVSNLFFQYQHDWTVKNFQSMTSYVLEPFYSQQKQIFKQNIVNNFDIIYDCDLSLILPVDFELKEDRYYFRIQINGKMINFQLSESGYVLTGESYSRSFSEYWDVELKQENNFDNKLEITKKCHLVNITQISDSNLE